MHNSYNAVVVMTGRLLMTNWKNTEMMSYTNFPHRLRNIIVYDASSETLKYPVLNEMHIQWCKHNATVLKLCPYCTCTMCTETPVETSDHYVEYTVHITVHSHHISSQQMYSNTNSLTNPEKQNKEPD